MLGLVVGVAAALLVAIGLVIIAGPAWPTGPSSWSCCPSARPGLAPAPGLDDQGAAAEHQDAAVGIGRHAHVDARGGIAAAAGVVEVPVAAVPGPRVTQHPAGPVL